MSWQNRDYRQNRGAQSGGARQTRGGAFPRHTHFIGVPVPPEIEEMVEDCRDWMRGKYGCKSGYGTPPHITLLAPFALLDGLGDADVFAAAEQAAGRCKEQDALPLEVRLTGFGSFLERTLFVHVEDSPAWQTAHTLFAKTFSRDILAGQKMDGRRFYPHLSVANRDIPPGMMDEALKHFAELELSAAFTASEICVYTRTPTGGWESAGTVG